MAKKKQTTDKKYREGVKGDPYYEQLMENLLGVRNNMETIRTLSRDELEIRKYEVGLTTDVPNEEMKRERKRINKKKTSKKHKSLYALRKYINKSLNILLDSRFTFHFDGLTLTVLDVTKSLSQEHTFCHITSNSIYSPNSFLSRWLEVFEQEKRFQNDINLKKGEIRVGNWVEGSYQDKQNNYGRADLNLMSGGFVDVPEATYKKYDMIPAMLCRNEFVFTQEAVRGAGGRLGHAAGAKFLTCLMDHYEREAKKYPHTAKGEEDDD